MLNRGNAFANTINKERKTIGSPISKTVGEIPEYSKQRLFLIIQRLVKNILTHRDRA